MSKGFKIFCLFTMLFDLAVIAALWFTPFGLSMELWVRIVGTVIFVIAFFKDVYSLSETSRLTKSPKGDVIWKDTRRNFLGMAIFSFTKYSLTKEKLYVETGFFNKTENEIRLYRVTDLSLAASFGQRLLNIGTITVTSSDKTLPTLHIKDVKRAKKVKELISKTAEAERVNKKVTGREVLGGPNDVLGEEDECNCCDPLD